MSKMLLLRSYKKSSVDIKDHGMTNIFMLTPLISWCNKYNYSTFCMIPEHHNFIDIIFIVSLVMNIFQITLSKLLR